jgi:hypothetical protein
MQRHFHSIPPLGRLILQLPFKADDNAASALCGTIEKRSERSKENAEKPCKRSIMGAGLNSELICQQPIERQPFWFDIRYRQMGALPQAVPIGNQLGHWEVFGQGNA